MRKAFLISEAGLYIVFMTMDLLRIGNTNYIKFAAICLIAASTFRNCEIFTARAQRLTPLADVFLLLLNGTVFYIIGVFIFYAVQVLYTLRLRKGHGLRRIIFIEIMIFAAGMLWTGMKAPGGRRAEWILALAALIYIVHFAAVNLTGAAGNVRRQGRKSDRFFFAGLLLYFICDLFVGIWNLPGADGALREVARVAMWGFYLPGQVLIRCSACERNS